MYIIVIGCGKVGSKLASTLSEEGHDVVIIDSSSENFKMLGSGFNGITIIGVPIDEDILREAGIEKADALAAVTPDDNINIMVSQLASKIFRVPKVISRIYNPSREKVFHEFGLDTICPTSITVNAIRSRILNGHHQPAAAPNSAEPDLNGDTAIEVTVSRDTKTRFARKSGLYIVIVGGGKVGYYLAKTLMPRRHEIIVIEGNIENCRKISNDLGITTINGDGTNIDHLIDAEIERADVLVAVTGNDQNNLVACQLASKKFNVKRTIARVNNPKNIKIFKRLGVGTAVSSTSLIADLIEEEIDYSGIRTLLSMESGRLILSNLKISPGSPAAGKNVRDIQLPRDCILISIIRNSRVIIPGGDTQVLEGDEVLALSSKNTRQELHNILIGGGPYIRR